MAAKTDIKIKASASLAMEATDSSLKALNITEQANAKHAVSANAAAELNTNDLLTSRRPREDQLSLEIQSLPLQHDLTTSINVRWSHRISVAGPSRRLLIDGLPAATVGTWSRLTASLAPPQPL